MVETLSGAAFREILARFASGVTVVTAHSSKGPVGFTATGFTSASLVPPLVLVCIDKGASVYEGIVSADHFGVSILAESQIAIARRFATSNVDRFENVATVLSETAGVPLIEHAIAHVECRRVALHDIGDHTAIVGAALQGGTRPGEPLVHFGRRFGAFVAEEPTAVKGG
jgi:flavin reductase (DIM6/NTAB) family NADH-FMN oxidoreductase RutF